MRQPISTDELLSWMDYDWVELWQIMQAGGMDDDTGRDVAIDFVLRSVEPGLRDGRLLLGHVLHAPPKVGFDPIHLPVDDLLALIRDALSTEGKIDWPEVDLWLGTGDLNGHAKNGARPRQFRS